MPVKLDQHVHKLEILSNLSNEGSRNGKVSAQPKQDIQSLTLFMLHQFVSSVIGPANLY